MSPRGRAGGEPGPVGRWWRRWWREVTAFVVAFLVCLGFSLTPGSAFVLACAVAVVAVIAVRLQTDIEPDPEPERRTSRDGSRGDLQDLAWAMVGRDGHAGERALRRLREIARVRLARHGADLDDPADDERVRALVGGRGLATLRRRTAPLPSVGDLTSTLAALERLGPRPAEPSDDAPPTETDHRTVLRRPARTWRNR
jgi:hypothetical protein